MKTKKLSVLLVAMTYFACGDLAYCQSTTLDVWVNAFIPHAIDGLTIQIKSGPHKNQTAIHGPVMQINDCFLTDQRSFSDDPKASSRVSARLTATYDVKTNDIKWSQTSRCGSTIEVDCEDGDIECEKTASTSRVKWTLKSKDGPKAVFLLSIEAANPCFTGSPDIDVEGVLEIDFAAKSAVFSGLVEPFPAFEMYGLVKPGTAKKIFQRSIEKGAKPDDLFGKANQKVAGSLLW